MLIMIHQYYIQVFCKFVCWSRLLKINVMYWSLFWFHLLIALFDILKRFTLNLFEYPFSFCQELLYSFTFLLLSLLASLLYFSSIGFSFSMSSDII